MKRISLLNLSSLKSPAERDQILQQNFLSVFIPIQDANLVLIRFFLLPLILLQNPIKSMQGKTRKSSKPQQHLITNQGKNECRKNVKSFEVFRMILELLKCKPRKLWTETQSTETGALLSTRLKWCTFQPSKAHASTRKSFLWKLSLRCWAEIHSSPYHKYDAVFHFPHKSASRSQFPVTLLYQLQKLYFTLPARLLLQRKWPTHSTQCSLIPGKKSTAGWAGCQDSRSPRGATRATRHMETHWSLHWSFALWRRFSVHAWLSEPAYPSTHR